MVTSPAEKEKLAASESDEEYSRNSSVKSLAPTAGVLAALGSPSCTEETSSPASDPDGRGTSLTSSEALQQRISHETEEYGDDSPEQGSQTAALRESCGSGSYNAEDDAKPDEGERLLFDQQGDDQSDAASNGSDGILDCSSRDIPQGEDPFASPRRQQPKPSSTQSTESTVQIPADPGPFLSPPG